MLCLELWSKLLSKINLMKQSHENLLWETEHTILRYVILAQWSFWPKVNWGETNTNLGPPICPESGHGVIKTKIFSFPLGQRGQRLTLKAALEPASRPVPLTGFTRVLTVLCLLFLRLLPPLSSPYPQASLEKEFSWAPSQTSAE